MRASASWSCSRNILAPGGQVIKTASGLYSPVPYYHAQAFLSAAGKRKLLLVSKRASVLDLALPGFAGAAAEVVDQTTGGGPARSEVLDSDIYHLGGYAVAVLTLP